MSIDQRLPKIKVKKPKRLGRGYGSGKGGHTSSRGSKGQKSRSKLNILFEGLKTKKSFIKRLPLRRGKGKFKSRKDSPLGINLYLLNDFKSGSKVSLDSLVESKIISKKDAKKYGAKILGNGHIDKKIVSEIPTTDIARKKIEAAGGKVTV